MRYIGDVHGKFPQYKHILNLGFPTVQVGDMGVGFLRPGGKWSRNPPHYTMIETDGKFIRGNHDNPKVCREHSQCITDGAVHDDIMYIGGALSIDREWRTEGYDWWSDEELSTAELCGLCDVYQIVKPRIMVTHDCPESIAHQLFGVNGVLKFNFPSRTRQALQSMLEIHQPKVWVFGHWHKSRDVVIDGTRFVCLAELEWKDID